MALGTPGHLLIGGSSTGLPRIDQLLHAAGRGGGCDITWTRTVLSPLPHLTPSLHRPHRNCPCFRASRCRHRSSMVNGVSPERLSMASRFIRTPCWVAGDNIPAFYIRELRLEEQATCSRFTLLMIDGIGFRGTSGCKATVLAPRSSPCCLAFLPPLCPSDPPLKALLSPGTFPPLFCFSNCIEHLRFLKETKRDAAYPSGLRVCVHTHTQAY